MKTKEVVDDLTMKRAITRITYEIIRTKQRFKPDCAGGDQDARCLHCSPDQERLSQLEQIDVPVAELRYQSLSRWHEGDWGY